jgi:hypothetical protein
MEENRKYYSIVNFFFPIFFSYFRKKLKKNWKFFVGYFCSPVNFSPEKNCPVFDNIILGDFVFFLCKLD